MCLLLELPLRKYVRLHILNSGAGGILARGEDSLVCSVMVIRWFVDRMR